MALSVYLQDKRLVSSKKKIIVVCFVQQTVVVKGVQTQHNASHCKVFSIKKAFPNVMTYQMRKEIEKVTFLL